MWNVIVSDAEGKETFRTILKAGRVVTIGRGADQIIRLGAVIVSRQHGRIELRNGKPTYFDGESANGSKINGDMVRGPTTLTDKSTLEIGGYKIQLQPDPNAKLESEKPAAPPSLPPLDNTLAMMKTANVNIESLAAELEGGVELTPMAPPPPKPAPKPAAAPPPRPAMGLPPVKESALPGMSFVNLPPVPKAGSEIPAPKPLDEAADLLDHHLHGIRSHRENAQKQDAGRQAYLDQEWAKILESLRQLHAKIHRDPRVQIFTIARDGSEVTVKLTDAGEKRGYRYLVLSRQHPDRDQYQKQDAVWIREFGRNDTSYREPREALRDLVQRIAGTLA